MVMIINDDDHHLRPRSTMPCPLPLAHRPHEGLLAYNMHVSITVSRDICEALQNNIIDISALVDTCMATSTLLQPHLTKP